MGSDVFESQKGVQQKHLKLRPAELPPIRRHCVRFTGTSAGDAATLYDSVHSQIFSLPRETIVFPGHDYNGPCACPLDAL